MKYYVLQNPRFFDFEYAYGEEKEIDFNTGEAMLCSQCGCALTSLEWLPPYDVKVSKKKIGDFIFGTFDSFLCSQNFKVNYEKSAFKSVKNFHKVNLFYRGKLIPEMYYYPKIPTIIAFIDLDLIEFEEKIFCKTCQLCSSIKKRINGVSFLKPDLIKDDIFFISSLGSIFVSEKFKEFVEKNNFTNAEFIEAEDFKWDPYKCSSL